VRPLAVIGNLAVDVVNGSAPRPGGGPFHAARALRTLTRRGLVVTKCANGDRGLLLRPLRALGLPVAWRPSSSSASFRIEYANGDRAMVVEGLGDPWSSVEARTWVAEALAGVRWLHVAPLARSDFPAATIAELARGGRRLLLDGQGLVRPARIGPLELDGDCDREVLAHVAVLKLAEDEALALLGGADEERLAALRVPEVVVTRGERGALVWAEGLLTAVAARPALGRVDPTGAGDAFAAGYLAARAAGHAPVASARRASALVAALLVGRA
jgi:sugar/nucleoside kinase (ribokinase family)